MGQSVVIQSYDGVSIAMVSVDGDSAVSVTIPPNITDPQDVAVLCNNFAIRYRINKGIVPAQNVPTDASVITPLIGADLAAALAAEQAASDAIIAQAQQAAQAAFSTAITSSINLTTPPQHVQA